jgi:Est1 DNA/RNA binding domain
MRSGAGSYKRQPSGALSYKEDMIFYDFILAFFRFQGILYTKIGIDELDELKAYFFKLMQEYFAQIDKDSNKKDEINKIIHLSLCMIFAAHATIAEGIKDIQKQSKKRGHDEDGEESKHREQITDSL